jgi:hypothetical protein
MAARANETLGGSTDSLRSFQAIDVSGGDVTLSRITRGVYVGTSGDINVLGGDDNTPVVIPGLAAGMWHPMQVQKILQTSTTAAGIRVGY